MTSVQCQIAEPKSRTCAFDRDQALRFPSHAQTRCCTVASFLSYWEKKTLYATRNMKSTRAPSNQTAAVEISMALPMVIHTVACRGRSLACSRHGIPFIGLSSPSLREPDTKESLFALQVLPCGSKCILVLDLGIAMNYWLLLRLLCLDVRALDHQGLDERRVTAVAAAASTRTSN